jgi:hypothetical protein
MSFFITLYLFKNEFVSNSKNSRAMAADAAGANRMRLDGSVRP